MSHVDRVLEQWGAVRPDLDLRPMGLIGHVTLASRLLTRAMEATIAEQGLSMAGFDVLATLRRSGEPYTLSPSDLIDNTMVTSGTMTHRVDQLVKAGLVERVQNPDDGRSVLIQLSKRGIKVVEQTLAAHLATMEELTAGLTDADANRLEKLLRKLIATLD